MNSALAKSSALSVPLLDLKAQYAPLADEIRHAIDEVCASQYFILGPKVKQLEAEIAAYSQCEFGIGVSSGTDALLLALMALDVGPGDEVLTSPYTFFATAGVISRLGARPIFIDIEAHSYNISTTAVEAFINQQCKLSDKGLINTKTGGHIKVIMPVHLYGQCADMHALLELAKQYKLKVVEDAAQAIGAEYTGGLRAGSMGDIGCFSFFPSKNLGAFGDAGLCVTRDAELAEKMRILRVHGSEPKYYHSMVGGNFRLDELQAAVLSVKLPHLDSWTAARQKNAHFYDQAFAKTGLKIGNGKQLSTPQALAGYRHIYNQYIIRVKDRDQLRVHLQKCNIGCEIYYPVPLHMQQCFDYLQYQPEDCPQSALAADQTLALPIYPELTQQQLQYVVDSIVEFYN